MSLILKGIDMPEKNKSLYIRIFNGEIEIVHMLDAYEVEHTNAQAIQIPTPHGRLIDASELIKSYMRGTKTGIDDFYDTIDIIDNAPTILEAEE